MNETACTFCKIRNKELDADMVHEETGWLAFLDRSPLFHGHVLLIPRPHHRNIFELPDEEASGLMLATKRLSVAVREAMESDGVFIASNNGVSQSVDHLHIHVVPRRKKDGLRGFMWPRKKYESPEQSADIAQRIGAAL